MSCVYPGTRRLGYGASSSSSRGWWWEWWGWVGWSVAVPTRTATVSTLL